MCRTVTVEMLAKLVVSYNHHLCAVSTEEVPEMLNNLIHVCVHYIYPWCKLTV